VPTTGILNRAITRYCCSTAKATISLLRPDVHSAEDWEEVLLPEIERQQKKLGEEVVFRPDGAFAKPEIYESLKKQGVKYAIRLPANVGLERDIEELLTRPVRRPSHKPIE
jgi:hypothetical protein